MLAVKAGLSICMSFALMGKRSETNEIYSYGMVLAKEKNDKKALSYFIQSVHKYTMNWGCWLEMTSLISRVEDVCHLYQPN